MKENKSYNPREVLNNDRLDIQSDYDFYWRARDLMIDAGYDPQYVDAEIHNAIATEKVWLEGKNDFRVVWEKIVGTAIARKNGEI